MKIARIAIASLALVASQAWAAPEAVISFAAPTKYTDGSDIAAGTAVTYSLYQAPKGSPLVKVATLSGTSATVTTGLQAGSEVCFAVTAVINGQESAQSNSACKSFPVPVPSAVVITVR